MMAASGSRRILASCWCCCGSGRMHTRANKSTLSAAHRTTPTPLQFDDHRTAFQHKKTWELLRALLVLRACGSDLLVDNSLKILREGQKILGEHVLGWLLRPTLYSQFVAGQEISDLAATAESLHKLGMRLMVAPTLEEDVGESSSRQDKYDKNLEEMIRLAEMMSQHGGIQPCLQTKITALVSADTLRNLSQIYVTEKVDSWRMMVQHIASAMLNKAELPDIPGISRTDKDNLCIALGRFKRLGETAAALNLRLLVDAEYSYVNPGSSLVALAMMAAFNQKVPVVANTYQCYFKKNIQ